MISLDNSFFNPFAASDRDYRPSSVDPYSSSNPENPFYNPYYREPDQSNFNRRSKTHDYTRPAKYLITILKNADIPSFCQIQGNPASRNPEDIRIILSPTGESIAKAVEDWKTLYPIFVPEFVIMPDHIHVCLQVVSELKKNEFGRMIARLMGKATASYRDYLESSSQSVPVEGIFSKGYNDRIAYTEQQWVNQQRYTRENPRRYLFKKSYPDYLRTRWLLTMQDGRQFVLMGNIFLLRQPHLFRVKTSRHYSPSEVAAATAQWRREAYNGSIPISPFIHPHERSLRDWAGNEGFSYIRVCTNGFAERESASGMEFDLMTQGRVLLIGQPEFKGRKEDLRYDFASRLNELSAEIADCCNQGEELAIRKL